MEQKNVQNEEVKNQAQTEEELKRVAKKIFEGEPLTTDEAMMLTDRVKIWAISSYVWDLVVRSI
jgi:uncharacterized coiled-coil DUF342 family protein